MKRLVLLLCLLPFIVTSACSDNKKADWTILVYMAADNNLSEQAIDDIIQMEKAKVPSSINVIVQLDPSYYNNDPQARRYKIKHSNSSTIASPVIEYLGEIDSGDYLVLADFVNWGMKNYQANHYALVIWSHGSGWTREERWICPDNQSINQMSIANGAFRNGFKLFNEKIDILLLDACYMQSIEVITEVYPYVDYIVGSEEATPFDGFPYLEILNDWDKYHNKELIANNIAEQYINAHLPGGRLNPDGYARKLSCSVAKSNQINKLLASIENFTQNWTYKPSISEITLARSLSYQFNLQESDIDLRQFFWQLYTTTENDSLRCDAERIVHDIDEVFVSRLTAHLPEDTGAATIWFPVYKAFYTGSKDLYEQMNFANTGWSSFLQHTFSD